MTTEKADYVSWYRQAFKDNKDLPCLRCKDEKILSCRRAKAGGSCGKFSRYVDKDN